MYSSMYAATTTSRDLTVHKKKKMSTTTTTPPTNVGEVEGRDLISELPDPILHCILSYLNMTNVFQTSFLSKRWRYLWTTLPFLYFDNKVYDPSIYDIKFFVARVLNSRNNQDSNIQSFRFSHHGYNTTNADLNNIVNHISRWIQILNRSNVQEIDIHLSTSSKRMEFDSIILPISLFACTSLTTLKLDFSGGLVDNPPRFELPVLEASMICLPALKTLHLTSLLLHGQLENSIELLISTCLALETLIIKNCIGSCKKLNICNPHIKSLTIEKMMLWWACEIMVFAPKMTSFSCTDYIGYINNYSFVNISSLVKAEIDIVPDLKHYEYIMDEIDIYPSVTTKNTIDCFRRISNVRSLMLSAWLLEPSESMQISPFCNLSFLTLKTLFSKYQIRAIMYLLENCPNLEYLVLKVTKSPFDEFELGRYEGWEAELAPQCIMHHLRLVEIWDAVASVNELEFLKFLLKNALVLEKMIVITSSKEQLDDDNTKRFRGFSKKLKSFRGASTSSEIFFQKK